MKKSSDKTEHIDAVFEKYGGKKRFEVMCPGEKKPLRVAAPSEEAAIVAAARKLGKRWTQYDFYAFCGVIQV